MNIYRKEFGSRKRKFFEMYDPKVEIDVKKTSESFGVSTQAVYKWLKEYRLKK